MQPKKLYKNPLISPIKNNTILVKLLIQNKRFFLYIKTNFLLKGWRYKNIVII